MSEPNLSQLQDFLNNNKSTFCHKVTKKGRKDLMVNMRGGFEVYKNNTLIWEGMQPYSALEKYNEIKL